MLRSGRSFRLAGLTAAVLTVVLTITGCASNNGATVVTKTEVVLPSQEQLPGLGNSTVDQTLATTAEVSTGAAATVSSMLRPKAGSTGVSPNEPVTLTVFAATLESVVMKGDNGTEVEGKVAADKRSWTTTERLDFSTTYTVAGTAKSDTDGKQVTVGGKITTVKPAKLMGVQVNIPEGGTVGVGAPIIITFLGQVANKAAVEKALTVTTSQGKALEGNWGWVQDEDFQAFGYKQSQVHWRPTKSTGNLGGQYSYWPAGTKVTVTANLKGVNMGGGIWGKEDFTRKFSIRPDARITKADASSFKLVVTVNGRTSKVYNVSYGKESVPGRATLNGPHIVMAKHPTYKMCNPQFDYCNVEEKWAVRINNNGEFIHENMQAAKAFGKANVSHGCVNMSNVDAPEFYNASMFGDPVEVTNASDQQMTEKDYIYDWIYSAEDWKTKSAIA